MDRCLSYCHFSFGERVVCSYSISGFRLTLCYLKTFLLTMNLQSLITIWYNKILSFSIFKIPFKMDKQTKSGVGTAFDNHWKFLRSTLSPTFTHGKMKLVCYFIISSHLKTFFFFCTIKVLHRSLSIFIIVSYCFVLDHYHIDDLID